MKYYDTMIPCTAQLLCDRIHIEGNEAGASTYKTPSKKGGVEDMSTKTAKDTLYTAGKVAKELGVKPGDVKKAITSLGIKPDVVKGACSYYTEATVKKIKKGLK
jgi:hypothetical protein